ncbi:hypothetical protein AOQ84DRAFT_389275 [Glonium stellatum]|uniref:Inactive metallocarboxypeptidase ECM14 n=1 Tax=Glonium stellatum TaxID=574774 RepID=A0A8E2EZJ7_9PEZI|nr:hypothetical protein AOQ84DRAFT_389275 [Glonium stellatum]
MRQLPLSLLSLLFVTPSLIIAAPPAAQCGHPFHALCPEPSPRPWRRLSDAIIRRIWGLPERQKSLGTPSGEAPIAGGVPSGKLLARYGEDIVMRFNISSADEASALAEASDILFLDVWEFNENWVDIRIAKDVVPSLLGLLPPSLQTSHVALMQDLDLAQAIFDSYPSPSSTQTHEDRSFTPTLRTSSSSENLFFQDYQPLSVIIPWMNLLASMFPTHVRRINVGISFEGRDIPALRVGVHATNDEQPSEPRKTILITAGSHAREWISTSTVNYLAWSLITSYGKFSSVTNLLESFDFVFVPTLNPDGYVYSWETDRLWRKNRQPTTLRFCRGVDLDRSYPFQWDGETTRGNPCSESFAGDSAFAGVEARRFAEWAKNETENNNINFIGFLDLHSYSQQILYPYSYSCSLDPPTLENLEELGLGLAKAIRISHKGQQYKVTSACEGNVAITKTTLEGKKEKVLLPRIETGGGSALDWFYHELRVEYAYQIKLRDTGSYGFLLPKDNIIPTGKEMLDAILYLGRYMLGTVGLEGEEIENLNPSEKQMQTGPISDQNDTVEEHEEETVVEEAVDEYDAVWELRRRKRR